jgi:RNA polymerase sigma factor (sigma-70 family)
VGKKSDILTEMAVLGARRGEHKSFEILVRYWQPRLLIHAERLTGDTDAAQDVMQDVWVAVTRGLRRLDDPARFKAWIYRITGNKSADWIRKEQSKRRLREQVAEDLRGHDVPGDDRDPVALVRSRLRMLPDAQRIVLTLFYLEELSVAEISRALSIPSGTVKSRLYHARNMLKEALEVEK